MAFTSWAALYSAFQTALANMTSEQLIQSGFTTGEGQTVTFRKYEDIMKYEKFLKGKMDEEANPTGLRRTRIYMGFGSAN